MTKRRLTAAAVTLAATCAAATPALAADQPLDRVLVRTEGKTATLAEGPLLTRGHTIQATSDATPRTCDATNNGGTAPRPTPTTSTVDAMTLAGRTFDGDWYQGFDDYFITQFGPDRQIPNENAYYGVLVNGIYTSVGGCQYAMNRDDVALWIYDAFNNRLPLRLDGPEGIGEPTSTAEHEPSIAPTRNTFTVDLGAPLTVHVKGLFDTSDRGNYTPAAGIDVSPVSTDPATGDQTVLHDDPATVVSDANGTAQISWSTPGWKRIKAERLASATTRASIRSNRLDVCVRNARGEDCGPLPADARPRGVNAPRFDGDRSFPAVTPNTRGAPATLRFTNPDSLPVTVKKVRLSGDQGDDFVLTFEDCTDGPIPPGGSCQARVRFAPSTTGPRIAGLDAVLSSGDVITAALAGAGASVPEAPSGTSAQGPKGDTGAPGPSGGPAAAVPSRQLGARTVAVRLASGGTPHLDRHGRFGVKLRCRAKTTCRGTLTLRTRWGFYLGQARYRVAAGRRSVVRVRLTKEARALLHRRGTLHVVARTGRITARLLISR